MTQCLVHIEIPDAWQIDERVGKHRIRRLGSISRVYEGLVEFIPAGRNSHALKLPDGTYVVSSPAHAPHDESRYLLCAEQLIAPETDEPLTLKNLKWRRVNTRIDIDGLAEEIKASWTKSFDFTEEASNRPGLRKPQLGALHAIFAHWSVSESIATIVLPTGTGKTETMLAALVAAQIHPLLVVVPSVALRDQITRKFQTLGELRRVGAIKSDTQLPIVGTLGGTLRDAAEVRAIFERCNVVVATMDSLTQSSDGLCDEIAIFSHRLFVDEAHHIPAKTWAVFRSRFADEKVVQFTATPFRGDKKILSGRVIYQYPLRKAQADGYFQKVTLRPVFQYDSREADRAIARLAIEQLNQDLANDLNHVVMARVSTIARAETIADLYRGMTEHSVYVIYHGLSIGAKRSAYSALRDGTCRIVVCVDMLGEGYDLPALKIAALHDAHRGLGITLQFIGRFIRSAPNIGAATAIANIADLGITDRLEELYSQDADWNQILSTLAEGAVGDYQRRLDFVEGFDDPNGEVSLQNIKPKKSAEVYRMSNSTWRPSELLRAIGEDRVFFSTYNPSESVAIAITRISESISWGDVATLRDITYDLILVYYCTELALLFIHSSDTRSYHGRIAAILTDGGANQLQGEDVFRSLHGINRLLVANLGLKHAIGKSIYFTMYAGVNVHDSLTPQNLQNKMTSNLFGFGFENGDRASAGCSYKGSSLVLSH
jgi:superfamily II DNA or RNA helicase